MKNKVKMAKQKSLEVMLNVVIIFLVLLFTIMIVITATELKNTLFYHFDESSFSYDLGYKDYNGMVYKYYQNKGVDYQGNSEMQEYYGVAKYYEAATIYKAYKTVGDTENSDFFLDRMKRAEGEMGDWAVLKEDILQKLGIEE